MRNEQWIHMPGSYEISTRSVLKGSQRQTCTDSQVWFLWLRRIIKAFKLNFCSTSIYLFCTIWSEATFWKLFSAEADFLVDSSTGWYVVAKGIRLSAFSCFCFSADCLVKRVRLTWLSWPVNNMLYNRPNCNNVVIQNKLTKPNWNKITHAHYILIFW